MLSCVQIFATPWTAACQASLSFTISHSLLKHMSTESVMPSNHLILCRPLLLLPSIFPGISVFSNESALCIRWPEVVDGTHKGKEMPTRWRYHRSLMWEALWIPHSRIPSRGYRNGNPRCHLEGKESEESPGRDGAVWYVLRHSVVSDYLRTHGL